jgi:hypothetical protein
MPKVEKIFTVECTVERTGSTHKQTGTLPQLIQAYKYTLECGESWQSEKGNKKINTNPKSIGVLVNNLNNAVNNSAANGYAGKTYRLKE